MAGHNIVVIGASSGGAEALTTVAGDLPSQLPAAVFVVLHLPEDAPSVLPHILSHAGPLVGAHPKDGEPIENGRSTSRRRIFTSCWREERSGPGAAPGRTVTGPAVDPLFRTAALAYGPRVVGVVLTGARNDGTAGLRAVKLRGGVTVVQDPEEALFPGIPESALEYVDAAYRMPLEKIPPLLARLAGEPAEEEGAHRVPDDMELESKIAGLDPSVLDSDKQPGDLSHFTCTECAGPLYEIQQDDLIRFRCRVGHAYTAESVLEEKDEELERALYVAPNTLEENALMANRLAARSREHGHAHAVARFEGRAEEARQQVRVIRRVLTERASEAV